MNRDSDSATAAHGAAAPARILLLTGPPGIGKTTVICRLAELLRKRELAGFYTQEIRQQGQRRGFSLTTFGGATCVLADINGRGRYRVGRYRVNVEQFEAVVLPELARPAELYLLDEIGKMECFSARFIDAVQELLAGQAPVVATVALKGSGFIEEVKSHPQARLWRVSAENRSSLPTALHAHLRRVLP